MLIAPFDLPEEIRRRDWRAGRPTKGRRIRTPSAIAMQIAAATAAFPRVSGFSCRIRAGGLRVREQTFHSPISDTCRRNRARLPWQHPAEKRPPHIRLSLFAGHAVRISPREKRNNPDSQAGKDKAGRWPITRALSRRGANHPFSCDDKTATLIPTFDAEKPGSAQRSTAVIRSRPIVRTSPAMRSGASIPFPCAPRMSCATRNHRPSSGHSCAAHSLHRRAQQGSSLG